MEAVDGGESVVEGGVYLRFLLFFFAFFFFTAPIDVPSQGNIGQSTIFIASRFFVSFLDDYSRLAIPLDDCSRLAWDKG